MIFALSFVLSWLGFAVIWWLIAMTHGDLEDLHLPTVQSKLLFAIHLKIGPIHKICFLPSF